MKKGVIFSIVMLAIFIAINSCDPILNFFDEGPNNGSQNNEQIRIKRIDYYQQDTINLSEYYEFFYSSDNEVNLINRYTNYVNPDSMKLYNSSTFNRNADTITEQVTFQNEITSKQVYIVQNNNLVKSEEYYKRSDGEWYYEGYLTYVYSSNKLISDSSWDNFNGTMEMSGEKKYSYINNHLTSYDDYGFYWQASTQTSEYKKMTHVDLYYSNNFLDSMLFIHLNEIGNYDLTFKKLFTYDNNFLKQTDNIYYNKTDSVWINSYSVNYFYDNDNLLDYTIQTPATGNILKTKYYWENGTGNVGTLWSQPLDKQIGISLVQ